MVRLALLACLLAAPLAAQRVPCTGGTGDLRCWATWSASTSLWRNHPFAHGVGGVGTQLFAYGPWFSKGLRKSLVGRLGVTVVLTAAWELELKKELPGYQWSYAGYDMVAAVSGALVTEGIIALLRR